MEDKIKGELVDKDCDEPRGGIHLNRNALRFLERGESVKNGKPSLLDSGSIDQLLSRQWWVRV